MENPNHAIQFENLDDTAENTRPSFKFFSKKQAYLVLFLVIIGIGASIGFTSLYYEKHEPEDFWPCDGPDTSWVLCGRRCCPPPPVNKSACCVFTQLAVLDCNYKGYKGFGPDVFCFDGYSRNTIGIERNGGELPYHGI